MDVIEFWVAKKLCPQLIQITCIEYHNHKVSCTSKLSMNIEINNYNHNSINRIFVFVQAFLLNIAIIIATIIIQRMLTWPSWIWYIFHLVHPVCMHASAPHHDRLRMGTPIT